MSFIFLYLEEISWHTKQPAQFLKITLANSAQAQTNR